MSRHGNDFRERSEKVDEGEMLNINVRYRSPLSNYDHLLGEDRDLATDDLSWCGFSLGYCRDLEDTGTKESLGGLWISDRKGGMCAECRRKQKELDEWREYGGQQ